MEEEERAKADEVGTPEEQVELGMRMAQNSGLDSKALSALGMLGVRDALKALRELEAKGGGIRNPSAWICKTAANLRERQRERTGAPPPQQQQDQQQNSGSTQQEEEGLGIVDHYKDLEVEEDADQSTIKKCYRKLVLKWHPDKHPEDRDQAEERIRAINNAYEVLGNDTKRAAYDAQRSAIKRQRRGQGPDTAMAAAPRQRIPREFMLQPIGYPDKFLRYSDERARAHCVVNSRGEAKVDGKSGLEQFVPFFKAAKLSLWWLPDVNNMCRIRALEARTRSSAGERVVAGRPGGFNLGFYINLDGSQQEADVTLMEAGKGEKNELVNFVVVPSPLYENAFRFEAAYRRGYFLVFRPPTYLKMIPYSGGKVPAGSVLDFTLVDFQAMFKFIDVEEVLRPVLETKTGWTPLEQVKSDPNVVAYFKNILQKPMWDDEDFQTYFEGHFESWQFRQDSTGPQVRLRGVDERLGYALERVRASDEAAALIVEAGDDVRRLRWKYMAPAFEALSKPGSGDVTAVLRRMDAHRKLLGALGVSLAGAEEDALLADLAKLAHAMQTLAGGEGVSPDIVSRSTEVGERLGKLVLGHMSEAERAGALGSSRFSFSVKWLSALLALPGVGSKGHILMKLVTPPLSEASISELVAMVSSAQASNAGPLAAEVAGLVLERLNKTSASAVEVAGVLRDIVGAGVALEPCASALLKHGAELPAAELASTIVAFAEKGYTGEALGKACEELAGMPLEDLSSPSLLAFAVASTKSPSLTSCVGKVVDVAVTLLGMWPAADTVRLLVTVAKTKGNTISAETRKELIQQANVSLVPKLGELPAAEIVRLALAVQPVAGEQGSANLGEGDAGQLLEAVGKEVVRRMSDLPQAHLLLLTQGLAPLGGKHCVLRDICGFWGAVLLGDEGAGDEVSRRRKEMERSQALTADQVLKLASLVTPLAKDLDGETVQRCFGGIGARFIALAGSLGEAQKKAILEQAQKDEGLGLWEGRSKLTRALEKGGGGDRSRSRSRKRSSRSKSRKRSRSRSGRKKQKRGRSSSSSSRSKQRSNNKKSPSRSRRRSKSRSKSRGKSRSRSKNKSSSRNDRTKRSRSRSSSRGRKDSSKRR